MIDYEKDVDRSCINQGVYISKFTRADKHLMSKHPNVVVYKELLCDPTTFCYLMFKLDGERFRFYPYQDMIANDSHRFKFFRASNQSGKSILLDALAAKNLIIDHGRGHTEAIVSKSLPQSTYQMRRVKALLNSSDIFDWKEEKGDTDSMSVMSYDIKNDKGKVKYSNLLICAPCTEGLLGYSLDELNLDEFEYWEVELDYFFNQIAQPRTYATKGNITIFTNPNGENFGAELERQITPDGKRKWHVYVFDYLDKPGNTVEEYEQLKLELPRQQFESTVAAIRSLSDRNYFTANEIENSHDPDLKEIDMVGKQAFFFFDVGAKHDQCCLMGGFIEPDAENPNFVHIYLPIIHLYPRGYPLTRAAGVEGVDDSDGWHWEKSVKEYLDEWSIAGVRPVFGYDVTGNEGMMALFESIGIFGEDVTFSGPSKSAYYQRFKYFMEKGLIHRIRHKDWEVQASNLEVSKSARGYLLINSGSINANKNTKTAMRGAAKAKRIADDCMDGSAGFIHLVDNFSAVPASLQIF